MKESLFSQLGVRAPPSGLPALIEISVYYFYMYVCVCVCVYFFLLINIFL